MLKLFNTLTKKIETFVPSDPKLVTLYACGPTVYDYAHIGNFRTYTLTDFLLRTLKYVGYNVKFVTNITDVGHLVSDADTGEDKLEKGARREGKTAWDVAKFYTNEFLHDSKKLNIIDPIVRPKPTEHILEQIEMVETLLNKGFAYVIDDGIYFDTSKLNDYGKLTGQNADELKAGARVEVNPQKKNLSDFALWKFSPTGEKRDMEWDSPWGVGFPGWHIECSAMSKKHLGDQIDIHTGGVDLIPIHHTNEIAQSESASGKKPFVKLWVHGQFIQVDGQKMSKSKNNFYRLGDIIEKGFDPLALRYLYASAHYQSYLNFTWNSLESAQKSLHELRSHVADALQTTSERLSLSPEKLEKIDHFESKFRESLENNLNIPQALAVLWEMLKSNIPSQDKKELVMRFDQVLGFNLESAKSKKTKELPPKVKKLLEDRELARKSGNFSESDSLRVELRNLGYEVDDTPKGTRIKKL